MLSPLIYIKNSIIIFQNNMLVARQILHEIGFNLFGVVDKSTGKSKIVNKNFDELMEFYSKTNSFILNLIWE